jgi:hypothetical protein
LPPKAEFLVELTWPDDSTSDIDLWFRAPTGEIISFVAKQNGLYSLDRDDLGISNDTVRRPDGSYEIIKINREVITMRGATPGTYTVNVEVYSWRDAAPIDAVIRVLKLNPYAEVLQRVITLTAGGQEFTAGNFTLDVAGNVIAVDDIQHSLTRP